jgi:hypothetical protein
MKHHSPLGYFISGGFSPRRAAVRLPEKRKRYQKPPPRKIAGKKAFPLSRPAALAARFYIRFISGDAGAGAAPA